MIRFFKVRHIIFILLSAAAAFGAGSAAAQSAAKPIPVFVSILPQAYFVERIAGDRASVEVLIPPGKSPAAYSPTPTQISRLSKARVYFRIGVPFERALMPKIKNAAPNTLVVDTRKGVKLRTMEGRHDHEHERKHHHEGDMHGKDEMDYSEGKDPHIWLDPLLVKIQAKNICDALIKLDPAGKAEYEANLKEFTGDLDIIHGKISKVLEPIKGEEIFVFHPAFGYLCDSVGMKQKAIEIEGKSPKGRDLVEFIAKARREKVRVIFVQPQFDRNAAKKIAGAINGAVVSINPLARDYLANLENMADVIAKSMER